MTLPTPVPGLVIRYAYLWHREKLAGLEEGQKDRPCAIVAAITRDAEGAEHVVVLPITHVKPQEPTDAVEIPLAVKRRLGLDDAQSWAVVTEWNAFQWPGPDLRRVQGQDNASVAYGMLPPKLFAQIRDAFVAEIKRKRAKGVARDS